MRKRSPGCTLSRDGSLSLIRWFVRLQYGGCTFHLALIASAERPRRVVRFSLKPVLDLFRIVSISHVV